MCTGHGNYLAGNLVMHQAVKYENGGTALVAGFQLKRKVKYVAINPDLDMLNMKYPGIFQNLVEKYV